jgi:hypothetical protein
MCGPHLSKEVGLHVLLLLQRGVVGQVAALSVAERLCCIKVQEALVQQEGGTADGRDVQEASNGCGAEV